MELVPVEKGLIKLRQDEQLLRIGSEQEDADVSTDEHVFMTDRAGIKHDCRIPHASDGDDPSQVAERDQAYKALHHTHSSVLCKDVH